MQPERTPILVPANASLPHSHLHVFHLLYHWHHITRSFKALQGFVKLGIRSLIVYPSIQSLIHSSRFFVLELKHQTSPPEQRTTAEPPPHHHHCFRPRKWIQYSELNRRKRKELKNFEPFVRRSSRAITCGIHILFKLESPPIISPCISASSTTSNSNASPAF